MNNCADAQRVLTILPLSLCFSYLETSKAYRNSLKVNVNLSQYLINLALAYKDV
jgi:hypothetical protein